jgi:hypothetical protein
MVIGRWAVGVRHWSIVALVVGSTAELTGLDAQTRPSTRKPAPAATRKPTTAPAELACPSSLGAGITSKLMYCDVLTSRDPKEGIIIKLPARRGVLTLRFNLHNRHTYSEEQVRLKRAFASYTASIGVLTLDNTLLTRAVVASEFRTGADLVERITGGAGPGGVKAVAPVGSEPISVEIPADVTEVALLGEKLTVVDVEGVPATYSAPGRPIAVISSATVEYVPAPARGAAKVK